MKEGTKSFSQNQWKKKHFFKMNPEAHNEFLLCWGFLKWILENSLLMFIEVLPTEWQLGI
jgi:hypothetical protein